MKLQVLVLLETSLDLWVGGIGQRMAWLGRSRGDSSTLQATCSRCVPHCPDFGLIVNEGSLGRVETLGKKSLPPLLYPLKVNGIQLLRLDSQLE